MAEGEVSKSSFSNCDYRVPDSLPLFIFSTTLASRTKYRKSVIGIIKFTCIEQRNFYKKP